METAPSQETIEDVSGVVRTSDHITEAGPPWRRRWRLWLAAAGITLLLASASCQASGAKEPGLCRAIHSVMRDLADLPVTSSAWDRVVPLTTAAEKVC